MKTRRFMLNHSEAWKKLMDILVDVTVQYLEGQVDAGAEILQLFDSWVGQLGPAIYREKVLPFTSTIVEQFQDVPMIHFGTKTSGLLKELPNLGLDVISLDWRIELDTARSIVGNQTCFQGNLDPGLLLAPFDTIKPNIDLILDQASTSGHIFNLGHGVLPDTQPDTVRKLINYVRTRTSK
jgi:uroporphyrinogen decarboxylase